MTHYIKNLHTTMFTGPTGREKSHFLLDFQKNNTASILTTSLLFAQRSDGTRYIMQKVESDMMTIFSLSSLKTCYINE